MTITLAPDQTATLKALGTFLAGILPSGVEVFVGQTNRVPEPKAQNYVVMTPIRRDRLETNVDSAADVLLVGSISGTTLTVSDVSFGTIKVGSTLFGTGALDAATVITALGTGSGGIGTYGVSPAQTLPSQVLAAGLMDYKQPTNVVVQIDVHGPAGADNAQRISTLFRDDYAVRQFASYDVDVVPLHADDPKQLPFINAEQQYEDRWVVEANLQANEVVTVPQQYAGALAVDLINVDASYPPS